MGMIKLDLFKIILFYFQKEKDFYTLNLIFVNGKILKILFPLHQSGS